MAPAELEALLLSVQGVQVPTIKYLAAEIQKCVCIMFFVWSSIPPKDAGVIGIPDEESGEVPRAFIVRAPGSTITGAWSPHQST